MFVKHLEQSVSLYKIITNSTKQNPSWQTSSTSIVQAIPHISFHPMIFTRTWQSSPSKERSSKSNSSHFLQIHLILSSHQYLGHSSDSFPQVSTPKPVYAPTPFLPHTNIIFLLHMITWIAFGKQYGSRMSSVCHLLQSL